MKKIKRFILSVLFSMIVLCSIFAKPAKKSSKYVCSTSWVAAIAELAGIDDAVTIAPANLRHPPEYEITPQDIVNVTKAELIMFAGYEKMVKTMTASAEINQDKMIKVTTTNTIDNLEKMVNMLSEKAGTQKKAIKRFDQYKNLILETQTKIKENHLDEIPVYVNTNQAQFAKDLGLNVVDTFGPGPLTSKQIEQVAKEKYAIVIDNVHNPVADPIRTVSPDSKLIVWRNFPESLGNNALYNVIKGNIDLLLK